MGMLSLLDHADIINMNVSVTMVKARISWLLIFFLLVLCQTVFWTLEKIMSVLWCSWYCKLTQIL